MGFSLQKDQPLEFHHLIVPKRHCKRLEENGYLYWNGAILCRDSHSLLHKIEMYDRELFLLITKEMVEENLKGRLDPENQRAILELLKIFIEDYKEVRSAKGKPIVNEAKVKKLILPKSFDKIDE